MCTVTLLRLADDLPGANGTGLWFAGPAAGFRLACNRDEREDRPASLPPREAAAGRRRAVLPIDPLGGGTWIAVNDAGLALALLNQNAAAGRRAPGLLSRGRIIPSLLHCEGVEEAAGAAARLHPSSFGPFRMVMTDGSELAEVASDGEALQLRRGLLPERPVLYTSSGLGDAEVERPRRALFEEMLARGGDPVRVQDAFHDHAWPDRPHLSVRMSRRGARTVSRTVITVLGDTVALEYHPAEADASLDGPQVGGPAAADPPRRVALRRPRPAAA
jgi:hypothetical protein